MLLYLDKLFTRYMPACIDRLLKSLKVQYNIAILTLVFLI